MKTTPELLAFAREVDLVTRRILDVLDGVDSKTASTAAAQVAGHLMRLFLDAHPEHDRAARAMVAFAFGPSRADAVEAIREAARLGHVAPEGLAISIAGGELDAGVTSGRLSMDDAERLAGKLPGGVRAARAAIVGAAKGTA